jgi:hypothetical protein
VCCPAATQDLVKLRRRKCVMPEIIEVVATHFDLLRCAKTVSSSPATGA